MQEAGFRVGPPIDLSRSPELNLAWIHVAEWLTWMISCATFSIMRRPRLRSKEHSLGFDPHELKTALGNMLGYRACQVLYVAWVNGLVGMLENPFSSYMKHLPAWKIVSSKEEVQEVRCDSCRFGSPHLKSFRLMGLDLDISPLKKRCRCKSLHLKVEGSLAKASAIYTDPLAGAIADEGILRVRRRCRETEDLRVKGFECQLVNEVAKVATWELVENWTFKKTSHINLLEESAVLRLCNKLARGGCPKRIATGVDSSVVRFATSKGRTSSRGLSSLLRRVCSLCVAAGLCLVFPYIPTRLNCADDPTREHPIRPPIKDMGLLRWGRDKLYDLAALPKLRRWAATWVVLVIKLMGPSVLDQNDRALCRSVRFEAGLPQSIPVTLHNPEVNMDFDHALGFPGEGPVRARYKDFALSLGLCFVCFAFAFLGVLPVFLPLIFVLGFLAVLGFSTVDFSEPCRLTFGNAGSSWLAVLCSLFSGLRPSLPGCRVLAFMVVMSHCMAMEARTPAELRRATERALRPELPTGRPVTSATTRLRDRYWATFVNWAESQEIGLQDLLSH